MEPNILLHDISDSTLWLQSFPDDLVIFVSRLHGVAKWHFEASVEDTKVRRGCNEEDRLMYDEVKIAGHLAIFRWI